MKKTITLTLFLAFVSALAGGILAYVNSITSPIIEEKKMAVLRESLQVIFPNTQTFTETTFVDSTGYIVTAYQAGTDGYAFRVKVQGYANPIEFLVGIKSDSTIGGFSVTAVNDTPGLGMKVKDDAFKNSIVGKSVDGPFDTIAGATVSSGAVVGGINAAVAVYKTLGQGGLPDTLKTNLLKIFPNTANFTETQFTDTTGYIKKAYKADASGYVFSVSVQGFHANIDFLIGIKSDNTVAGYIVTAISDSSGYGMKVSEAAFINSVVGKSITGQFDLITGATISSSAVVNGIEAAIGSYQALTSGGVSDTIKTSLQQIFPTVNNFSVVSFTDSTGYVKAAYKAGTSGYVFSIQVQGYRNRIEYLVGISPSNTIAGYKVTYVNDTPGRGMKVGETAFINSIIGKPMAGPFDTISGATISSRAVIKGIGSAVAVYQSVK